MVRCNGLCRAWVLFGSGLLLLFWLGAGVGIIGHDGDPANRWYALVLGVGLVGATLVRMRSAGMVLMLRIMAGVQALIGGVAIAGGWGRPWSGPLELAGLNGFFVLLFMLSSAGFKRYGGE